MSQQNYQVFNTDHATPIKSWTLGVAFEDAAKQQLLNIAQLPFIHKWLAVIIALMNGVQHRANVLQVGTLSSLWQEQRLSVLGVNARVIHINVHHSFIFWITRVIRALKANQEGTALYC